jgi:SurA N-terminal domain
MKLYPAFFTVLCCIGPLCTQANNPSSLQDESSAELIVYNRILAKVNGKTISVIDIMKKMDLFLQKNYPQLADSKVARYQFYSSQWREYLSQMIDTELMIADAEKLEVKITEAEVREEILNRFGPNVMPTLDKLGLTYEETKQMIHDEMLVQRMIWFRVNSKVLVKINSTDVKEAYKQHCLKHPETQQWQYQVISIRSPEKTVSEHLASKAYQLLNAKADINSIAEHLKAPDDTTTITISPEMEADEKNISSSHKEVLSKLCVNTFSEPVPQISRVDHSVVYRIFYLKKHSKSQLPSFEKMADQLKDQLLQEAASKENSQYILKLRERLGYDEKHIEKTDLTGFEPFALR